MQKKRQANKRRGQAKEKALPKNDYRIFDNRFGGMPDSFQTILEYSDVVTISSGTAPQAGYIFRGNSMYDPDYTSTGHQPRYFDQNMAVYSRYLVLGAKITVQVIGVSSFIIVLPSTDPLAFGPSALEFMEYPRAHTMACGNVSVFPSPKLTAEYRSQGILGLSRSQLNAIDYSGTSSTNPNQQWYINIAVIGSDRVATSLTVTAHVHISYQAVFYDRTAVSPSFSTVKKSLPQPVASRTTPNFLKP